MVRQRSAKPLFIGSIPIGASLCGNELRSDGQPCERIAVNRTANHPRYRPLDAVSGDMARQADCDGGEKVVRTWACMNGFRRVCLTRWPAPVLYQQARSDPRHRSRRGSRLVGLRQRTADAQPSLSHAQRRVPPRAYGHASVTKVVRVKSVQIPPASACSERGAEFPRSDVMLKRRQPNPNLRVTD